MRDSTLTTLGLGTVHDLFRNGRMPADTPALVDKVFGPAGERGALVISGANGIVGAGKTMQLGSRLRPYDIPVVALDFPGSPDGIGKQYAGLLRAFGAQGAARVMENVIRLSYDGKKLPDQLRRLRPRFLVEAIPEILDIKRQHYAIFRETFPGIEIRSVTSGFPSRDLGVGIAHPAFPHEINKIWEIVEAKPSAVTQLMWSMGLIPVPVSDDWSFVLDVLFCGITLAALRCHHATNMPYWKIDKFVRRLVGPNPLRAHDAIGAGGANFLTWSCLHHLSKTYGPLFEPTPELVERQETGENWYPPNHFRPLVDWSLEGEAEKEFDTWILGPLYQMTCLMLKEKRGHLSHINAIGELCAQFRNGILADMRARGPDAVLKTVEAYHRLHPEAATSAWHPGVLELMGGPDWQQLYVNAEHDGTVGVVTINRESYNSDVDAELNRALDWLKAQGVRQVIVTGDFHLATQMVGADTNEFYPALEKEEAGFAVSNAWSRTARRLETDFAVSVGFVNGKRCLGGFLELMAHCHYLVAVEDADLGFPEVTLPVVPGMEGCHWPLRKARPEHWPNVVRLLLTGRPVQAKDAVGWLVDFAGPTDLALQTVWKIASKGDHKVARRPVAEGKLDKIPLDVGDLPPADSPEMEEARKAIADSVRQACGATLGAALDLQSKHSAAFMRTKACLRGRVGAEYTKTMKI